MSDTGRWPASVRVSDKAELDWLEQHGTCVVGGCVGVDCVLLDCCVVPTLYSRLNDIGELNGGLVCFVLHNRVAVVDEVSDFHHIPAQKQHGGGNEEMRWKTTCSARSIASVRVGVMCGYIGQATAASSEPINSVLIFPIA